MFILFLFLFILSLLTASVPSSLFRREGLATYKAVVLVILPSPILFLGRLAIILSDGDFQYQALLWLEFCWISILPIALMMILFAPIVSTLELKSGHRDVRYVDYLDVQFSLSSLSLSLPPSLSLSLSLFLCKHPLYITNSYFNI